MSYQEGRYSPYTMTPADHIRAAEELLTEYETALEQQREGRPTSAPRTWRNHLNRARVHVDIALAQMQGAGRMPR